MKPEKNHGGKRPGDGRKPAFEKSTVIHVRVPDSWIEEIEKQASTRTEFVRQAIREKLNMAGEKNGKSEFATHPLSY
jgi:metal-responsive CopG/Arc/MetJ family transcriptional regulator